jgi:hypothetical protein
MKLSGFIVGVVLSVMVISIFGMLISETNDVYSPIGYDNSSLEEFQKMQELRTLSQEIQNETLEIQNDPDLFDIVGSFFANGYQAMRTSAQSIDLFNTMVDGATDNVDMGSGGNIIKQSIITIVILLLFIGVFLSAILKKDI